MKVPVLFTYQVKKTLRLTVNEKRDYNDKPTIYIKN